MLQLDLSSVDQPVGVLPGAGVHGGVLGLGHRVHVDGVQAVHRLLITSVIYSSFGLSLAPFVDIIMSGLFKFGAIVFSLRLLKYRCIRKTSEIKPYCLCVFSYFKKSC